jgi:molybdopterin/thiamine biosynthesis adenylyltransferase
MSYLDVMSDRIQGVLSPEEMGRVQETLVCCAGAGGVGGWTCHALARFGVRRFRVADPDVFDPTNANRQCGCTSETIGQNKAEVIAREIRSIQPAAEVQVFNDGVTPGNLDRFLDGGDVLIDAVDAYSIRLHADLLEGARRRRMPAIASPVLSFGTALAVFDPDRSPPFARHFHLDPASLHDPATSAEMILFACGFFGYLPLFPPRSRFQARLAERKVPTVPTSCMVSGAWQADAVVDWRIGRRAYPVVPTTLHLDLAHNRIFRVGPLWHGLIRHTIGAFMSRESAKMAKT